MVAEQPDRFNGTSLIVPYLGLSQKDQALIDSYKPIAKILNWVMPTYQFDIKKTRKIEKWLRNWADDPLYRGGEICAHNILLSENNLKHFNEKVADKVRTPFLMVLGGKDTLVCNKAAKQFFENNELKDKDLIEYEDANHCII